MSSEAAVLASVKVRNLKANHSSYQGAKDKAKAVLASVKVRNLKANHSRQHWATDAEQAVLASVKVRNLKANHSCLPSLRVTPCCCISKCEGTKSES